MRCHQNRIQLLCILAAVQQYFCVILSFNQTVQHSFYVHSSAVLKAHQGPIKHSHECVILLLFFLSTLLHSFTILSLFTLSSTSSFMMPMVNVSSELVGYLVDNGNSLGDAAEAHGTNWYPQRLGNCGADAPCHYRNCNYFWRPQQLRDPNDGEPRNPANWPRLLTTNLVRTASPKRLWNVWPMKWANVWKDLREYCGWCPRSTLMWFPDTSIAYSYF